MESNQSSLKSSPTSLGLRIRFERVKKISFETYPIYFVWVYDVSPSLDDQTL